ncbi:FAD-binding oxidoreductase [Streptomyces marispadix]|uniref:FAD-dependent oxidoreductase n=1 Tax=Streptomyces marispadix TaxID=2922868 RepID=A0ABS9SZ35_9ACTN|nr:FAD-dependent oxidoreductase [Streptomyces marispadix]MCH6161538.1 FAD-dependent oxidoreductase [Streptomyces marispadix]
MKSGSPNSGSADAGSALGDGNVRGRLLRPADAEYADETQGFQAAYRHRPDLIVRAAGADDVAAAVGHAAAHRMPVAVQATGHGLTSPQHGGMLISTRRMSEVRVDPGARTAWIGAGVRWGRVVEQAARYGLAPLSGSGPGVGAVSYTLNGGVGLLAREFGYAADHVRVVEIVTADARVRHVTADRDPELFWALRGGGGGLGVVTGMEIGLMPVERFHGGQLIYDGGSAGEVLEAWREWTATAPERLTSSLTLMRYPDLPVLPGHLRGRHVVQIQLVLDGGEAEGERLVAPLRAAGPRISETLRTMPYGEGASVYNEPDQPHPYQGANVLLGERLPDRAALDSVVELTGPSAPAMTVLNLRHMGGALSREPAVPNAVGGRDAGWLMTVLSVPDAVEGPEGSEGSEGSEGEASGPSAPAGPRELRLHHQRVFGEVAPWTVGTNLNFRYGRSAGAAPHAARAAYPAEARRRLAELKASLDPLNLFRFQQGRLEDAEPEARQGA